MLGHLKGKAVTQTAILLGFHRKCRFTHRFAAPQAEIPANLVHEPSNFASFAKQSCRFWPFEEVRMGTGQ